MLTLKQYFSDLPYSKQREWVDTREEFLQATTNEMDGLFDKVIVTSKGIRVAFLYFEERGEYVVIDDILDFDTRQEAEDKKGYGEMYDYLMEKLTLDMETYSPMRGKILKEEFLNRVKGVL